eukprot:gene6985-12606_t
MDQGTGGKLSYTIKASCTKCKIPPDFTTSNRFFNVTGLSAYTRYDVRVYSINNVTAAIGFDKAQYNSTSVLTGSGLPSEVQNLTKWTNSDASVTIFWNEPLTKGGDDLRYFVTVNGEKGMFTTKLKYTVKQEQETKKYTVSVSISLTLVIAVVVTLFVLLLIAGAFVVYFYRRRHPKHLQPVRLENGEVILPSGKGVQVYIDPTTYQDLEDAVQQFANELDRSWIKLDRLIGGGEFGDVYKGTMEKPSEKAQIVAVKTLKSNANKKARDDFLGEAMYMGQFDDPNVINLEGVVVKDRPILIVIEFMSNGSLDSFLQENDGKFTPLQLLGMARGVASGMKYLSEMSYIHRDLAARNILVNDDMVCKVADFGMSRELSEEDTYNTTVLERLASGYRLPPPMSCPKVVHDLMLSCWHKDRVKRPKFKDIRGTIDKWIRSPELLKHEESVVTRRVYSINNVTAAIGFDKAMYNSTSVLTGSGLPSEVQNLTKRTNSDASVTIFWNEPLTKGGDDLRYFITVNGEKGMFTTKLKYTVKQEQETKKYTVSVSSLVFRIILPLHMNPKPKPYLIVNQGGGISLTLVIAVVVTLFVLLLIAGAFVVYFYRRRHPKHLQPVRLENGEVILPSGKGVQVYIDPTTYQDLEDAVQQFANELDRSWIKLDRLIGGGEFGDVYKGTMEKPSEKAQIVAVKTLKSNANKKARDDFLGEAMYMGQFDDPNVINLEGVVVKDRPILIVIEFMSNGSLDSFLQENDGKFTPLQLLGMARGVASGMKYLSEMSYIHRDLAARNILVNDDMVCKVADFGMSRELSEEDTYNTTVLERLASGYRLPPPMRGLFAVVLLVKKLMAIIDVTCSVGDTNLDYASMKTLKEWLDSIGMSRYIENFTKKGLVTPRQILELTDPDLKDIGIEAVGHRNKIMKNINLTKGQLIRTKSMAI